MRLYLVQHAEAKAREEDPERPLSEKGRADIERVAALLAASGGVEAARIHHSGKARARETAEVLSARIERAGVPERADGLEPLADPRLWGLRLARERESVVLVGHLPHLSRLASLLLCGDEQREVVRFARGGVVYLERGTEGNWTLRWMVTPEIAPPTRP